MKLDRNDDAATKPEAAIKPDAAPRPVALGAIQETLLIPLYARALETRKRRPILHDARALEMVRAIDYDFRKFHQPLSLVGSVVRTAIIDCWVRDFLGAHPDGTVVELGAGLNTRFERVDNGRLRWVDIDLPDSMALRRRFFADGDRRALVAGSLLDDGWVATVQACPPPRFFAIEAVLFYLDEAQVRDALGRIARHFPGALVALDTAGALLMAMQQRRRRRDLMKDLEARQRWVCDDPRQLADWGLGLSLRESRTLADAPAALRPRLPWLLRTVAPLLFRRYIDAYRLNLLSVAAP